MTNGGCGNELDGEGNGDALSHLDEQRDKAEDRLGITVVLRS